MKKSTKKEEVRARLVIHDFAGMSKTGLGFFRKWIAAVAEEMQTADPKDYSNPYRATLYKQ